MSRRRFQYCSFCGRESAEVRHLIEGPEGVRICNWCTFACVDVLEQRITRSTGTSDSGTAARGQAHVIPFPGGRTRDNEGAEPSAEP